MFENELEEFHANAPAQAVLIQAPAQQDIEISAHDAERHAVDIVVDDANGRSNAEEMMPMEEAIQEIPPNQDEMDANQDEPDYQDDNDEDDVEIIEISDTEDDEMVNDLVNELPFWAIPRRKHTTNRLQYSSIGCDICGHFFVTNNGQTTCQTCMIRFN